MRHNKVLAVLQAILSTCSVCGTLASAQGSPARTKGPKAKSCYSGDNGPGFWAEINPDWKACGNTEGQSPVDIPGDAVVDPKLTLALRLEPTSVVMFNDGHTIRVNYTDDEPGPKSGGKYNIQPRRL